MSTIGKNIKNELERRGLSQKDLCTMTGISESAMSKYLAKDGALRSDILIKISKALGVNVYFLMEIDEIAGSTFDVCRTALMARSGTNLSLEEKKELIDLIFEHK